MITEKIIQNAIEFLKQYNAENNKQFFDLLTSEDEYVRSHARKRIACWIEHCVIFDDYLTVLKRSYELGVGLSLEKSICMYGEVDGRKDYDKRRKQNDTSSKESKMRRYGPIEGAKRYKAYCERQAYTNSKEHHGMTDEEFKAYNKSRAVTLKNMIKRHGEEEGTKKFQSYCERQAYTNSKEYFIEKLGKKAGIAEWKRINKAKHENKADQSFYASKVANSLFDIIDKDVVYESFYNRKNLEYSVWNKELNSMTFFDYVIPELKLCIEFNGDIFHANPSIYCSEDRANPFRKDLTAKDIWEHDKLKNQGIIDEGYELIIVWEKDYREDPKKIIKQLCDIIDNKIKKDNCE